MADQSFGDLLVAAMDSRGITRSGLASRTGLHATAIAHFVSGRRKPSVDNLRKIADGVGCSVDELLGRKRTDDGGNPWSIAFNTPCGREAPTEASVVDMRGDPRG